MIIIEDDSENEQSKDTIFSLLTIYFLLIPVIGFILWLYSYIDAL